MLFHIPADHPALAGHFPGNPVVPGVVLLDHIMTSAQSVFLAHRVCGIRKLKWLRPVLPEQRCDIQWAAVRASSAKEMQARFVCLHNNARVVEGNVLLEAV